jgi:GH15 family glucan-1,4-alpha-glucosidase
VSYLPIEHHGVVGDLHTAALVGLDGTVDWLCLPYFDSPSLFASILDSEKGGFFRIAATNPEARRRQMYLPDSNVLVTRFLTPDGVGEVVDFMPVLVGTEKKSVGDHQLIRIVRGVRGDIPFRMECAPAFDYARRRVRPEPAAGGFRFAVPAGPPIDLRTTLDCRIEGTGLVADFLLREGQEVPVVISQSSGGDQPSGAKLEEVCRESFRTTLRFWQEWIARSHYQGRWREMVKRSALALKLMTFAPTGAIVAAPTTSLPERLGGDRNWDYRYTWVRDSAFTIYAFLRVGFSQEAEAFMGFLERIYGVAGLEGGLGVLYGIDGRRVIPEEALDHLEGYRGSRPVRVGNDAATQFQLDINGELIDAVYLYDKYARPLSHDVWVGVRALANWVCANWERPDEGIWEVRGGRRQFTFSKLMCWVALDRAHRIATRRSLPAERDAWLANRDAIYAAIMGAGYSERKRSFVQSFGSEMLDASLLLAPMLKFVAPTDPRMLGTLDAIDRELESDHLVRRYDPRLSPDGVGGEEGTFSMCTFWLAEALARAGRLPEARLTFEKMLGYANHLGLYAEQIAPTGEALGNFPQAFTHLGLISAAINISQALDSEGSAGRVPKPGSEWLR